MEPADIQEWAWLGPWLLQAGALLLVLVIARYVLVGVAWLALAAVACLPALLVLWLFFSACG